MNRTVTAPSASTACPRPSRPRNVISTVAAVPGLPFDPAGTRTTANVAVLLLTTPVATVPAGTSTAVPKVNGPPRLPPVSGVIVTVYDRTITLSRAVPAVTVGFLRLLRRVTQAIVVVPVAVDEGTLETSRATTEREAVDGQEDERGPALAGASLAGSQQGGDGQDRDAVADAGRPAAAGERRARPGPRSWRRRRHLRPEDVRVETQVLLQARALARAPAGGSPGPRWGPRSRGG